MTGSGLDLGRGIATGYFLLSTILAVLGTGARWGGNKFREPCDGSGVHITARRVHVFLWWHMMKITWKCVKTFRLGAFTAMFLVEKLTSVAWMWGRAAPRPRGVTGLLLLYYITLLYLVVVIGT